MKHFLRHILYLYLRANPVVATTLLLTSTLHCC